MVRNILYSIIIAVCSLFLMSCDINNEKQAKTLEDKLIEVFSSADQSRQTRIEGIIMASKDQNYKFAMNELALLSAMQINTPNQEQVIRLLMNHFRLNMEAEDMIRKRELNKVPARL